MDQTVANFYLGLASLALIEEYVKVKGGKWDSRDSQQGIDVSVNANFKSSCL